MFAFFRRRSFVAKWPMLRANRSALRTVGELAVIGARAASA
jgi:hypothetical protein